MPEHDPTPPPLDLPATVLAELFEFTRGPLAAGFGFTPWLPVDPAAPRSSGRWSWLRADAESPWAFAAIAEAVRTHG
ncbi:hypothetical protein ACFVMC_17645 [Nocardia sp. NPDC127579]|uniref:hypothetical protein n=1 Tax=Nocardia sp. NPDC127579 TaxID=3345402 RepID=UPI0036259719